MAIRVVSLDSEVITGQRTKSMFVVIENAKTSKIVEIPFLKKDTSFEEVVSILDNKDLKKLWDKDDVIPKKSLENRMTDIENYEVAQRKVFKRKNIITDSDEADILADSIVIKNSKNRI